MATEQGCFKVGDMVELNEDGVRYNYGIPRDKHGDLVREGVVVGVIRERAGHVECLEVRFVGYRWTVEVAAWKLRKILEPGSPEWLQRRAMDHLIVRA